jgi:hypothetical protein
MFIISSLSSSNPTAVCLDKRFTFICTGVAPFRDFLLLVELLLEESDCIVLALQASDSNDLVKVCIVGVGG